MPQIDISLGDLAYNSFVLNRQMRSVSMPTVALVAIGFTTGTSNDY